MTLVEKNLFGAKFRLNCFFADQADLFINKQSFTDSLEALNEVARNYVFVFYNISFVYFLYSFYLDGGKL